MTLPATRTMIFAAALALASSGGIGSGIARADDKKPNVARSVRSHGSDRHEDQAGHGRGHDDHRGHGGDRDRDRDQHRDRGHGNWGQSHSSHRPSYSHGGHGHSHHHHHGHHGHYSHRKSCGHIGACPTRVVTVCVRAGYYENRYVPAVTQTCYDAHGCAYTKVICPARWEKVWVPPVHETRHVSVCESRHTGFSFSFGF